MLEAWAGTCLSEGVLFWVTWKLSKPTPPCLPEGWGRCVLLDLTVLRAPDRHGHPGFGGCPTAAGGCHPRRGRGDTPTSPRAPWCRQELLSAALSCSGWGLLALGSPGLLCLWGIRGDVSGSSAGMCVPEITKGSRKSVCLKDFFAESREALRCQQLSF